MVELSLLIRSLGRALRSLVGKSKGKNVATNVAEQPVGLTTIYHGCMGLPQELIYRIVDMLRDDLPTLKACSLTCKAMLASTRHLVHRTLYLTRRNNESVPKKRNLHHKSNYHPLCFLSHASKRGILQYALEVHIRDPGMFTPDTLRPHLHHFQTLDRVHTLTVEYYDAFSWANQHKTCFAHFYPTLTSLTLRRSAGPYRLLMDFALQFPNLENLCLEHLQDEIETALDSTVPDVVNSSPPLNGRLRLVGPGDAEPWPTLSFVHELDKRFNFRSVELDDSFGVFARYMLGQCAHTLEEVTIVVPPCVVGHVELISLKFGGCAALRRLTLRTVLPRLWCVAYEMLQITTITSPVFREFVLELGGLFSDFGWPANAYWGRWSLVDQFLEQQFAGHDDFKLIVRTGEHRDLQTFYRHIKGTFPLLASKACIHFETSPLIDKHWG